MPAGWIVDLTKCIGCHACYTACKAENRTPPRTDWRLVIMRERGAFPAPVLEFISLACHHCGEPACLKSCPVDAITKRRDGVVLIDQQKCIGCRYCMFACPYGAPRVDTVTGKVSKCTLCAHRLEAGQPPACVETCLTGALQYVPNLDGPAGPYPEGFAPPEMTRPNIRFVLPN
jgi:Fe-S-cluster-containing dehydrogenase component